MPWTCPTCNLHVGGGDAKYALPRIGIVYRCPGCRFEMTFDPSAKKMIPVPPKTPQDPKRRPITDHCSYGRVVGLLLRKASPPTIATRRSTNRKRRSAAGFARFRQS
jgi:hypothetical protein